MKKTLFLLVLIGFSISATAQKKRERVVKDGPIDAVFKAPKLIVFNTTKNTDKNTLHMMIQHSFGPVMNWDNYQELWGLDGSANIRFSLDYGISDDFSIGIGRTKIEKAYDFRAKYSLAKQTRSGSVPFSVSIDGTIGMRTDDAVGYSLNDRFFGGVSVPVSSKVSDDFSLLIYPSMAFFGKTEFSGPFYAFEDMYFGLGLGGRYKLTNRTVLTFESMPVYSEGIRMVLGAGVEIETGSHVFQMFLTTSQYYTDPYMMRYASNLDGGILNHLRLGFNVNRLFWFD